jgi:hypothetical protein
MTTFFRSALGLLSPARVCRRRSSSLTRCASSIVRLSCAALYTGFGMCRLLLDRVSKSKASELTARTVALCQSRRPSSTALSVRSGTRSQSARER